MKFQGNILITDPCYVVKDNDWDICDDEYEGILSSHGVDSISAITKMILQSKPGLSFTL